MSSALAIAGVTAVLCDLLNDGMINHNVSGALGNTVTVSALPPDRVEPASGTASTQLNLFLHRVTPNCGWRNHALPSRDVSGLNRLTNPPLALDLHYLLSAYGAEDLHAEILLGYAMQLLHETPVLDRKAIDTALNPSPEVSTTLPPTLRALSECGLADQVEQIKLVPEILSTEEIYKLWSAVQAPYRTTATYLASVVLIQSTMPTRVSLPVLSRGPVDPATGVDRGVVVQPSLLAPFPTIQSLSPANMQPVATVGATVEVVGHHLDGTGRVVLLSNTRLDIEEEVDAGGSSTALQFTVPDLPVGIYQLAVRLVRPEEATSRTSNQLALLVGPEITTPLPASVARDGAGTATIALNCRPEIRPNQQATLLLGEREVTAQPFSEATGSLTFAVDAAPVGEHLVRLRVDGLDSAIIDRVAVPPVFFNYRITVT